MHYTTRIIVSAWIDFFIIPLYPWIDFFIILIVVYIKFVFTF